MSAVCNGHQSMVAARSEWAWVQIAPAGAGEVRVVRGVDGPAPQGWQRMGFGAPQPAPVLSLVAQGRLPLVFGYAILRMDYAIPLADPARRGRWTWMLGGYGV